ncbi:MAG: hypothetical protein WBD44_00700, partial [Phycisphaerae bacterium]
GSYAHKGMHMTWMEKVRKRAQKPVKTTPKTRKKSKKRKIRASPSYQRHPVRRKKPPDASAKAGGPKKTAQKYPPKLAPKSYPQSPVAVSRARLAARPARP